MNKWTLGLVFAAIALLAGLEPGLTSGLTPNMIVAALSAAALTYVGKVMDPNSIIELPPSVTAIGLALVAVGPMIGDAFNSGTYLAPQTWVGIVGAFLTAFYGKLSVPHGFTLARRGVRY